MSRRTRSDFKVFSRCMAINPRCSCSSSLSVRRSSGTSASLSGTLSLKAAEFLTASRTVAPDRLADVPADRRTLRELEQLHRGLIAMHLEKTLKSDRVLRDIRRLA